MHKIDDRTVRNNYAIYALGATRAEHRSEYSKAASLWDKAIKSNCSAAKLFWATKRAEFCESAANMGWRHPNAREGI